MHKQSVSDLILRNFDCSEVKKILTVLLQSMLTCMGDLQKEISEVKSEMRTFKLKMTSLSTSVATFTETCKFDGDTVRTIPISVKNENFQLPS